MAGEILTERITHLKGTPCQMGYDMGRKMGGRLEQNIRRYLELRPCPQEALDFDMLRQGALPWVKSLPERFQQELEGLATGAGLPMQRVAEWVYLDPLLGAGCSAFVVTIDGRQWVGRNNDMLAPEMWGYLAFRQPQGRLPTASFSMEGDVFTPTGLNSEKLWLHCHALEALDAPRAGRMHLPSYVFLPEALETCTSLREVEALLEQIDRDDGMLLFAVDGKRGESAVYECGRSHFRRRDPLDGVLIGTNHALGEALSEEDSSLQRYHRMQALVSALPKAGGKLRLPQDLVAILADERVERGEANVGTVYSCVACPASGDAWYTFGGYPAASHGRWAKVDLPWA